MKSLIIIVLCLFLSACELDSDLRKAQNDLAMQSFEYGYTACKAGIPRDEARKVIKVVLYK